MQLALWTPENDPDHSGVYERPRRLPNLAAPRAADPAELVPLDALGDQADHYAREAHAEATRKAYNTDWAAFEHWCDAQGVQALPASARTLELYLTHLAGLGRKASTIRRARIAIGLAHGHAEAPRPDQNPRIRAVERGIGRVHGAREESAVPLLETELKKAVSVLGHSPHDERDRAMLLLGFAGAFRASELAGLNVVDVTFGRAGLTIEVRKSKEDQLARGKRTEIPFGQCEATCPVRALEAWIARVGRPAGPLFRVIRGAHIEHERIHPRAVSRAVQRAVARAGLEGDYSAHSLRAGLATSAYAHGATEREIQLQGRWEDPRSVQRYIHMEHVPGRRNVAEGLL